MSYAQFEEEPMPEPEEEEDEDAPAQNPDKQADEAPEVRLVSARGVFERAYRRHVPITSRPLSINAIVRLKKSSSDLMEIGK